MRPLALANKDRDQPADIYIAAKRSSSASTGDLVAVRLLKGRRRGPNLEGEIVEILERETHQFVGTYFESAGGAYVNVDGNAFSEPIGVGDPGTRNAQPGDKVVIDIVRFPHYGQSGEAVLTKVIGAHGQAGVETEAIIYEFNLPQEFPEDVLEQAREQAAEFDESIGSDRTDLTEETIITIDPVDARDFDDAISLERLDNGTLAVGRAYCGRRALRATADRARSRSTQSRDERVLAGQSNPDVARDDLEQRRQFATGSSAVCEDRVHRVLAGWRASACGAVAVGYS